MLRLEILRLGIAVSLLAACDATDYVQRPEPGYLGSIDIDGPDVGKNHYGDAALRDSCSIDPNGATRLTFVVAKRSVQFGRWHQYEYQRGSVAVSAPNDEPRYEVDLPWSHLTFDAAMCTKTETGKSAGPQNIGAGMAKIECTDPERGDTLKVNVNYQGC
jgi:hypothetical protein